MTTTTTATPPPQPSMGTFIPNPTTMANITLATTDPAAATDSFNLFEDSFAAFLRAKRNPRSTTTAATTATAPPALSPRLHGVYSPRLPSALPPSASPRLVEPVTPDRQPVPFYNADDADLSSPTALRHKEERLRRVEWARSCPPIQPTQSGTVGVVDEAEADDLFARVPHRDSHSKPPAPPALFVPDPSPSTSSPSAPSEAMSLQIPVESNVRLGPSFPWSNPNPSSANPTANSPLAALFSNNDISPTLVRRTSPHSHNDLLAISSATTGTPAGIGLSAPVASAPSLAIPPIVNFPMHTSNVSSAFSNLPSASGIPPPHTSAFSANGRQMNTGTSPMASGNTAPPTFADSLRSNSVGSGRDTYMSTGAMNGNVTNSMFMVGNESNGTSPVPAPMDIAIGAGAPSMGSGNVMTPRSAAISALLGSSSSTMSIDGPSMVVNSSAGVRKRPPRRDMDSGSSNMTDISPNKMNIGKGFRMSNAIAKPMNGTMLTSNQPKKSSSLPIAAIRRPSDGSIDPLQCHICEQRFARRSNLFKHLRSVHEELRRFACTACSFKFKRQDHLLKHTRSVHAKVRKFSCDICGIGFAEKFNRDKHCRSIHQTKRAFQCPCGAYFQDRNKMLNCLRCRKQAEVQQGQQMQTQHQQSNMIVNTSTQMRPGTVTESPSNY